MTYTPIELQALQRLATKAAESAAALIQQNFGKPLQTRFSKDNTSLAGQVVTEIDQQAQQIILDILEPSLTQYDLALLAEESADDGARLVKPAFWCIDPLDGTLPFSQGKPGFAVSIGLVQKDATPLLGVVADPLSGDLYQAISGQGASLNGKALQKGKLKPDQPLVLRTDLSFKTHPWLEQTHRGLQQIATRLGLNGAQTEYRTGSVLNACSLIQEPNICYFKFPKSGNSGGSLWDYAASTCIFNEVKAVAADIFGNQMDLNRADSTFMNHLGLLFAADKQLAREIIALHYQLQHS